MRGKVARNLRKMAEAVTDGVKPWFDGYQDAKGVTMSAEKTMRLGLSGRSRSHLPQMLKEGTGKDLYREYKRAYHNMALPGFRVFSGV